MATDAARLNRYPECNNPHVLICMQFIVNLSAPWLPPVYSLISNEGIKTPSLIARHLKQRITNQASCDYISLGSVQQARGEKSENE